MRPQRYPKDRRLSRIADQLQVIEEELTDGDPPNAERLRKARGLVVDVAMGVRK
ncbi:MAG: hypothetical protein M3Y58_23600 [Chloroflexota bacterium]|nr:hypothetical protein [Chloroflexota bacterium]